MEFRTYAANETSALAKRLLAAQTEASAQHIRALREALDATMRALEESPPAVADDVQEFVKKLTNATAATVKTASQRLREEAQAALDGLRKELESEREQSANLATSLEKSTGELAAVRTELRDECERTETLQRDLAALLETHKHLETAHEDAQMVCAVEAEAKAALESELREARALLDAAFEDTARLGELLKEEAAASSALKVELEAAQSDAEAARAMAEAAQSDTDAARAMAEAAAAREVEARAAVEFELQEARASLDAALAEDARLGAQLETGAAEKGKLLAALSAAQSEFQTANEQRDAIASQLKAATARAQSLEKRVRDQSAGGDHEAVRAENGLLRVEIERLELLFDASLRGLNELGSAGTVTDLLAALVKQLSAGFARVALFRVKSNRLEGEFQRGFDQSTDVTKLVMPLNVDSPLTRVVNSGEVETLAAGTLADGRGVPFGGTSAPAIALPIVLQDQTLAVVYADHEGEALSAAGAAMPESTARFARLLVRQSVVLLMRMTHELKTLTELRDYAALLLQEAERMHSADADAGTSDEQLRGRLKDSIECARTLYAQRASLEGPGAAALLDEQISAALEAKAGSRFARDLAALVGRSAEGSRRAAEAS